jgi:hypothetical protein
MMHEDGVAVGFRRCDLARRQRPAGPGHVLDDDLLA